MAKKKTCVWYGITNTMYDLKITEVQVTKVTETRIYLAPVEKNGMNWNRQFVKKQSSYEQYFPSREDAVAAKLKALKGAVRARAENLKAAKKLLAEFKDLESV